MPELSDTKASIRRQMHECHARIDQDVQKLKDRPEFEMLPSMVKCYIDIVIIDIELLQKREQHAHDHIDRLDEMLDSYKSTL